MIVLGIDPGTTLIGYGVIEETNNNVRHVAHGVLKISGVNLAEKLPLVEKGLKKILAKYRPDVAGLETLFFSKNKKTALLVAQARGVLFNTLLNHKIDVLELSPADVKIAVTNYGLADKKMVATMAGRILGLTRVSVDDNATDALALALATSAHYRALKRS